MYLFSFQYGSGFGKYHRVFKTTDTIGNPWDLFKNDQDIFLVLGEEISFFEKYNTLYPFLEKKEKKSESNQWLFIEPQNETQKAEIKMNTTLISEHFFDEKYLNLLHWMVNERFSDYKNVMKYFIPLDIESLLKREPLSAKQQHSQQNLYIFPDNRTRFNFLWTHYKADKTHLQLFSTDTDKKKNENRRAIKYGQAQHIFVTQSEIFQPYNNLKTIYFIDPYKRYYHNQQDPRYSIKTVVKKLQELYQTEVKEIAFQKSF